jgi:glycosyltransferase involved in cell wall biosynthesis
MPQLRALRDSLSSREDIFLVGYRADASSLIADADVCAVPSVWEEAFGLAVVEAMAQGKPVVASRVGGIPELVRDGVDGLLVPPGRPEALARALAQLLADPLRARRMGRAARKAVRGRFGLEEKLRRVLDLLEPAFGLACVQPGAVPARAPASLGGRW